MGAIFSVAASPNGKMIATGCFDGTARIIVLESGKIVSRGHRYLHQVSFNPGCDNGEVHAWSVVSGRLVWELPRAHALVKTLGFSRDGVSLAVGCANGDCMLYSADTRSCTSKVQCDMAGSIRCMGFSPAAALVAVCAGPTPGKKSRGRHRPENAQLELQDAERAALPAV
ncbi:Vegetative incompatibility protein HET-E-1 [Symbiodinium microadriaticum]|uniref:Vegetative incompatibility protein HET-E-1 n=1 Tax=Symbiodinium microadriaticum TaxID=2951 RepID=A0A1Q9DIB7_SYMMI|nr:Vegetative incompatibility protein HET-E-1 [Symbiodinium microadriaticum]